MKDIQKPSVAKKPIIKIQITNTETNKVITVMGYSKACQISGVNKYQIQKYINTTETVKGFRFASINV